MRWWKMYNSSRDACTSNSRHSEPYCPDLGSEIGLARFPVHDRIFSFGNRWRQITGIYLWVSTRFQTESIPKNIYNIWFPIKCECADRSRHHTIHARNIRYYSKWCVTHSAELPSSSTNSIGAWWGFGADARGAGFVSSLKCTRSPSWLSLKRLRCTRRTDLCNRDTNTHIHVWQIEHIVAYFEIVKNMYLVYMWHIKPHGRETNIILKQLVGTQPTNVHS